MGCGSASAGDAIVFVVLFCQKLVEGLLIEEREGTVELRGRFLPSNARLPVLLAGIRDVAPAGWDASARRFLFRVPRAEAGYLRLGYLGGAGDLVVTNAIRLPAIASPAMGSTAAPPAVTSPPGTVSPEAQGRFAAPAAPP
jgi:hypothetical protein